MRGLEQIRVLCLMTGGADLNLRGCCLHGILGGVQVVAARAGDVVRGMGTRWPIVRGVRLMTSQALGVLFGCRCQGFRSEIDHTGQRTAARFHMRTSRTVTGLALQPPVPEGPVGIIGSCMLGAEDARDRGIVVTAEAGVGSLRTVGRIGMRWAIGLRCGDDLRWSIGRERVHETAYQQSEGGSYASTRKLLHSVRRDRDVVHHPHVCDSAGTVADAAGLNVRRVGTDDRATFRIFRDGG